MEVVLETMREFSRHQEAAVGRGAYRSSQNAGAILSRLRLELATWIDAGDPNEISFHSCGTTALNTAIFGFLKQGDHVVTTAAEHNSVLRPLKHLVDAGVITWTIVPVDAAGVVSVESVIDAVEPDTSLVAVTHAANVNGAVQPIAEIGNGLRNRFDPAKRPAFLCDAAQTFGCLPLSVGEMNLDFVAAPGHKSGCGPLGTGFLYARTTQHPRMRPTIFGGTGTQSESLDMPHDYPGAFEAGNQNVPALAGWLAGLQAMRGSSSAQTHLAETEERLKDLARSLYDRLQSIDVMRIVGIPNEVRLPVASVAIDGLPASDLAMILDSEFGIETRSGMHCAAMIHEAIGSPSEGTLRMSASDSTSSEELDALENALREIVSDAI